MSAIAIFAQLDAAFDRIWRLPSDPHETWVHYIRNLLIARLKALGMLLGVGAFVLAVMIASIVVAAVPRMQNQPGTAVVLELAHQHCAQLGGVHGDLQDRAAGARFAGARRPAAEC